MQYEGQSLSNKPHGFGVVSKIYKNGFSEKYYNGTFVSGKKQGFGGLWTNNFYYEGDFFADKKHGFGRIWYKNGSFYQGNWKDGSYHGDGMIIKGPTTCKIIINIYRLFSFYILLSDNGNRYQGKFIQGRKHGDGIFYHLKTGQMQKGYWINDSCVSSTIEDIYWRQSALQPSPYPIPKLVI